ncbi:Pycsar system effector family protein [Streptomyces sp. NPDC048362]|uniref:Pycsar system effector family protein n=1 Tax=Streptomyces sp. NPDC048362 TaxID=3365539 RepID=UPI00371132DD
MVSATSPTPDGLALSQSLLTETREELAKADQKANLLLAALGVAAAALIGAFASAQISPLDFPVLAQTIFWAGCAAASVALIVLGMAVYPNSGTGAQGRIYYFGDVEKNQIPEGQIATLIQAANHTERNVQQFVVLAKSVIRKYKLIRAGMLFSGATLLLLPVGTLLGLS